MTREANMNLRRVGFLRMLALATLLAPSLVEAQQAARIARVGWLSQGAPNVPSPFYDAFRQGMRDLGYVEGQNLTLEPRYTSGRNELWPELITDMDRIGADVIVAGPFAAVRVAKTMTNRPIVMTPSADPVVAGVIQSLARPGGNITGITEMAPELTPKRLEMLKQIVPALSRVALLWQPGSLSEEAFKRMLHQTQSAARALGIELQVVAAREAAESDAAFSAMANERAEKQRLPAIYEWKEFVRSGGLISYGADVADIYRRAAGFVDRILKGAKPADIPVEGPMRFDMAVNLKTAKALGLTIPPSILAQAVEALD
jgi:putative ABC transport system substrate-binding protein